MKLDMDELDLEAEHREKNVYAVTYDMFTEEVRAAIDAVGKATFFRRRGTHFENYKVIFSPKAAVQA